MPKTVFVLLLQACSSQPARSPGCNPTLSASAPSRPLILAGAPAAEKSIHHGHPPPLHLWWARRPLAACREAEQGIDPGVEAVSHLPHFPAKIPDLLERLLANL